MFIPEKFHQHGSYALPNAQYNLRTRTHYIDDDTMRFHGSRVLNTYITDDGLLLALIESVATNYEKTQRGFRYVVFNIFGDVISRVDLENCWRTKEPARRAMWEYLNSIDAKAETLEALERHAKYFARKMDKLREECC